MNYTDVKEQRNTLADLMEQQSEVLQSLEMTERVPLIHGLRERLLADDFKVLVIGEFKTGKSTFINALLGEKVLPAHGKPTTAIINEVKWGEVPKVLLHFSASKDGVVPPPKEVPVEELADYVVIKNDDDKEDEIRENPYEKVELFYPLALCRNGVEVIDSPGLNEGKVREDITIDYLGYVDAVLFTLSAITPGVSTSERLSLDRIRAAGHRNIFFVYNRINQVDREEREEVEQHCITRIGKLTGQTANRIFFINARGALDGRLDNDPEIIEESGVTGLEVALETFLTEERGQTKIGRPATELKEIILEAQRTIPERKALLEEHLDLETLEERYAKAQEPLQELEVQRQQTFDHVTYVHKLIKGRIASEAKSFYATLASRVEDWAKAYTVQTPITSGVLGTEEENAAVKRVSEEVAQYITDRIEAETIKWQEAELQPLLTENLEELRSYLDVRIGEFLRQLDQIRLELSSGSAASSRPDHADEEITEPLNRVLAAIGGSDAIDDSIRPAIGATFNYQGTGGISLMSTLAASAASLLTLYAAKNPAVAAIVGGTVEKALGSLQAGNINAEIKDGVGQGTAQWLRENAGAQSEKAAEAIGKQFSEREAGLSQAMDLQINHIHEQVESIRTAKEKGQEEANRLAEELTSVGQRLDEIDDRLDTLIVDVERA